MDPKYGMYGLQGKKYNPVDAGVKVGLKLSIMILAKFMYDLTTFSCKEIRSNRKNTVLLTVLCCTVLCRG